MKYLAKVESCRKGLKLTLYLKFWFINIPIEIIRCHYEGAYLINELLEKWKKHYGNKLITINVEDIEGVNKKK